MSIQQELDDFLGGPIARRGVQFDEAGLAHTHNKADASAPLPPLKFNLCTSRLRPEGRLSEEDMDTMASFIAHGILRTRPRPEAIAGIPNVGADIAEYVEKHLRREGMYLPRLRILKREAGFALADDAGHKSGAVCVIDDLIHAGLSKQRFINFLTSLGYPVADIWVFLTYEQGGEEYFDKSGVAVHSVSTVRRALELGKKEGAISSHHYQASLEYLDRTRTAA